MLMLLFQPQIGLKIAKKTTIIKIIVGISLIILKYFDPNVFLSSLNAFKHDPR